MFAIPNRIGILPAVAIAVAVTGLYGIQPAHATSIAASTFDTDADGWTVGDIDNTTQTMEAPTYHATGGNPGGYISTTDDYDIVGFFAPGKFLGDQSAAAGGTISFDSRSDNVGNDGVNYPAVFLYGDGLVVSATGSPPTTGLSPTTPYSITLSASNFDLFVPGSGNESQGSTAPTTSQFNAILGDLTNVAIEADWHSGADLTGLDNVNLTSGPPVVPSVPEPASLVLFATGLIGLRWSRRRQKRE